MKISIITAVYNNQETIGNTLESILKQNYADLELVLVDGASTDGSLEIIKRYSEKISILSSEPDSGIYDALNKGIHKASGEVVGFLHADDIFYDESVIASIAQAFEDSAVEAVYGDLVYIRRDNPKVVLRYWSAGEYDSSSFSKGWMPPHPTFYVRRSVYERFGVFDQRYRISADYDLMLRFFLTIGINAKYIPKIFVRMRSGGISNRSFKSIIQKSYEDYLILRRNKAGGILTLMKKNIGKLNQFFKH